MHPTISVTIYLFVQDSFWRQCSVDHLILVCSEIVDEAYTWREGTQISGESSNPPADTLAPIYGSEKIGYVIWNDEPSITHCPGGCTSFVLGHSKGEQKVCFKTCACVSASNSQHLFVSYMPLWTIMYWILHLLVSIQLQSSTYETCFDWIESDHTTQTWYATACKSLRSCSDISTASGHKGQSGRATHLLT